MFESNQEGLLSYISPEARRLEGMDGHKTGSKGYAISQRLRKRIEECFGWLHTNSGTRKVKVRGRAEVEMAFVLTGRALNLLRIAKLAPPEMGAIRTKDGRPKPEGMKRDRGGLKRGIPSRPEPR